MIRHLGYLNRWKEACWRGHRFDEVNTYRQPSGARKCRRCGAIRARQSYWARKKEVAR